MLDARSAQFSTRLLAGFLAFFALTGPLSPALFADEDIFAQVTSKAGGAFAPLEERDTFFYPEPMDPEPLGDRMPAILVHGFETPDSHKPFDPYRNRHWDQMRTDPYYKHLFRRIKFYIFTYRPYRALPELAAELREALHAEVLPEMPAHRKMFFFGISAGALVSRYAASDPEITPRVSYIFSMNGANRGSVLASLATAKPSIKKKVGWVLGWMLSKKTKGVKLTPGIKSLAFDNYDGSVDETTEKEHGILVNHSLRHFNATDPNRHKVICYFGRPGWRKRNSLPLTKAILKKIHPSWTTVDPIIHNQSGLFLGAPLIGRRLFEKTDHWGIGAPRIRRRIFQDLEIAVRGARASEQRGPEIPRASLETPVGLQDLAPRANSRRPGFLYLAPLVQEAPKSYPFNYGMDEVEVID